MSTKFDTAAPMFRVQNNNQSSSKQARRKRSTTILVAHMRLYQNCNKLKGPLSKWMVDSHPKLCHSLFPWLCNGKTLYQPYMSLQHVDMKCCFFFITSSQVGNCTQRPQCVKERSTTTTKHAAIFLAMPVTREIAV
jgi:hypothetical protein